MVEDIDNGSSNATGRAFEPPQSVPTAVAAARPIEVVLSNRVYIAQEPLT